jgi:ABC-type iron transport system FetAB ATPase subunit
VISVQQLGVDLGGRRLFGEVSFQVRPGETVLVTGPSGGGKSTLLRAVLGFEAAARGGAALDGRPRRAWSACAYIAQGVPAFPGSLGEFLDAPLSYRANRGLRTPATIEQRLRMLDALNLPRELLDAPFARLSGGEKQRAVIIQTLQVPRRIRVLDEPTSALDADNRRRAVSLLAADAKAACLVVSHDVEWRDAADRVFVLADGRLEERGDA